MKTFVMQCGRMINTTKKNKSMLSIRRGGGHVNAQEKYVLQIEKKKHLVFKYILGNITKISLENYENAGLHYISLDLTKL